MCFTTRTPSPPPSIRLASRTPRYSTQSSTLPATIITRSPSTATKRTSHRYSNSTNTIDTAISHSPHASRPSVTIQTARPTAVTPRVETARPTGYRRQIVFDDDDDDDGRPTAALARRTPTTAATVASPRIPRSNAGAPPPAAPEPPPTSVRRPPPDRWHHRHTWSADLAVTTAKKAKSRGERSVRSAPEQGERDGPPRITSGRAGRGDRLSGVVARQGASERRARSVSRDRVGRGKDVDGEGEGEMVVVSRKRGRGFLGV